MFWAATLLPDVAPVRWARSRSGRHRSRPGGESAMAHAAARKARHPKRRCSTQPPTLAQYGGGAIRAEGAPGKSPWFTRMGDHFHAALFDSMHTDHRQLAIEVWCAANLGRAPAASSTAMAEKFVMFARRGLRCAFCGPATPASEFSAQILECAAPPGLDAYSSEGLAPCVRIHFGFESSPSKYAHSITCR